MEKRFPKQVIIEVTNKCNLTCKYCPNTCNDGFPVGNMTVDLFRHIADLVAAESPDSVVIPWMNGEPFLHPDYLEMVQYLSKLGLKFYVTTNLTIWREDILKFLLSDQSTCYQIIVSMDGVRGSDSIELARPGTNGKQLVSHVNHLIRLKREMDSTKDLAVKICERGQDWEEIEQYVQEWLSEDEAIDYVCVGKPLKGENDVSMRRAPCQYFDRNFMVIRWNGTCVPCAYNDKVANKGMLNYGQVHALSPSLLDVYNNEYMQNFRTEQRNGKFREPCASCSFAYTGYGFEGMVTFRNGLLADQPLYYHQDYYNMFFSLKRGMKDKEYYFQEER